MEKSSAIKAQAQKHLSGGNLDKALNEYEKLLALEDIDPYDYVLVGDVHLKKGATGRAVSLYTQAIDSYEKLGLFKNAAAIGKRILRLDPSQSDMHRRLGDIRMRAGLSHEAVLDFIACFEMKLREGDKDAAIEALEMASKANPADAGISEKLAGLYEQTSRSGEAAAELMRMSEMLRARGDAERASQYAARAVKLDANVGSAPANVAPAHDPQTRILETVPADVPAPPALSDEPSAGQADFLATTAAMEIEPQAGPRPEATQPEEGPQPEQAEGEPEAVESAPPVGQSPVESLRQRVLSRPSTVNITQVLKQFKAQMENTLEAADYQSHYDLGVTYKEMGLYEEALNEFRVASAGDDFRVKAFEMAGQCHLELEDFEDAVEAFRRALRERTNEDDEYPGLCFHLGRALEGLGRTEEALQSYSEVAALNPEFPGLQGKLQALGDDKPAEEEA